MTLLEFASSAIGGLITNDRGNGCGGPRYIYESSIVCALEPPHEIDWGKDVREVTEGDDPEAWQLIRDAFTALEIEGSPDAVAVVVRENNGESNPHQLIVAK
jgi:hypothetical protein